MHTENLNEEGELKMKGDSVHSSWLSPPDTACLLAMIHSSTPYCLLMSGSHINCEKKKKKKKEMHAEPS